MMVNGGVDHQVSQQKGLVGVLIYTHQKKETLNISENNWYNLFSYIEETFWYRIYKCYPITIVFFPLMPYSCLYVYVGVWG